MEIFNNPYVPIENKNDVQSWIDSQSHTYDKVNLNILAVFWQVCFVGA